MPSCSTAENPRGVTITFIEETHKYFSTIDNREITYTSGTQFLGKYFPKFDPTGEITARCAKKAGCSVEEIKARWEAKGKESCRLGTRLHETIEDILLKNDFRNTAENEEEQKRFNNGIKMGQKLLQTVDILGVEKIVFSDRLKIAGTIDLFAKSRKDNTFLIIDHKTNKEIDIENKYNKFCLGPISHIDDTSFMHYALQLNLYQYLLKYEQYVPKDAKFRLFLNHVTAENVKLIELPDLQTEIRDLMIEHLVTENKTAISNSIPTAIQRSVIADIDSL